MVLHITRLSILHMRKRVQDLLKYGAAAPGLLDVVWLDPRRVKGHCRLRSEPGLKRELSSECGVPEAVVVSDAYASRAFEFVDTSRHIVFVSCRLRWIDGLPWEKTPVYQNYKRKIVDGKPSADARTLEHLAARYEKLDRIFETVQRDGFSSRRWDMVRASWDPSGVVFWGPNGRHRLAMGLVAGVEKMPFGVKIVCESGLSQFVKDRDGPAP